MGSQTFTPKRQPPFRRKGAESVTYCGELPWEHRGAITPTLYVWTVKKPTRWVDRRDLPALLKAAGADNLDSKWVREYEVRKLAQKEKREEKKKLEQAQSAQSEEVEQ